MNNIQSFNHNLKNKLLIPYKKKNYNFKDTINLKFMKSIFQSKMVKNNFLSKWMVNYIAIKIKVAKIMKRKAKNYIYKNGFKMTLTNNLLEFIHQNGNQKSNKS